jgi:hypothetical protein
LQFSINIYLLKQFRYAFSRFLVFLFNMRSTVLSNWFAELMRLAGHSNFETTRKFYLSIKDDYLDMAREIGVQLESRLGLENWVSL